MNTSTITRAKSSGIISFSSKGARLPLFYLVGVRKEERRKRPNRKAGSEEWWTEMRIKKDQYEDEGKSVQYHLTTTNWQRRKSRGSPVLGILRRD
ncbi:hypothetical protein E2C01_050236 [Portunus trituberculatus]|uniref:Uncharacterized protein n=1 Tax=Portunus trituberculatus TaxID=210409 RepID=A0A5B7GFZ5_PORTR|nr:hypothetical protein [Portunus trituberculatus]